MMLAGKVIIISGVGPGLGRALASVAAGEGAKVVMGARNGVYLEEVAAGIRASGGDAIAVPTDVTRADQCRALADAAERAFGGIDGLVNSAYSHGEFASLDIADAEGLAEVFDVNCVGALRMAQACLPYMKQRPGSAIVNISTMSTVNPFSGEGSYAAAKGALGAVTRHMASDFGRFGIRVNQCRLGWIDGPAVRGFIESQVTAGRKVDEVEGEITTRIPLGVIPSEEDCAKSVLFFVSDYSKMVSGASLDVNGGQYMAP